MASPGAASNIDLSSGLVPKEQSTIDLSSGLVPKPTEQPPSSVTNPSLTTDAGQRSEAYKRNVYAQAHSDFSAGNYRKAAGDLLGLFHNPDERNPLDLPIGIAKGAGQTVATVAHAINKIPRAGETLSPSSGTQALDQLTTPETTGQKVGVGVENLSEFILGDEALKSLSVGERLLHAGRVAKLLEKSPRLVKAVEIGMSAVRQGIVGGGQAALHGEDTSEAAKAGVVTAGTAGILEAGGEAVRALAPTVKEIAGARIPVRASQESSAARALENVSDAKTLQRFDVEQTQPAARRAIGNVATEIRDTAAQKMGTSTLAPVENIEDAARSIKAQSKPVFDKLDALTKNDDMSFSDWQRQERAARSRGDIELANRSRAKQDELLARFQDQFNPDDLEKARANWRQGSALEELHDRMSGKQIVHPTPVELRKADSLDPGYIQGKALASELIQLRQDGVLERAGLTPQHVKSLQNIATLLEKGNNVQKLNSITKSLAILGQAAPVLYGHPVGASAIAGEFAVSKLLGQVMTNPSVASTLEKVLRSNMTTAAGSKAISKVLLNGRSLHESD